MCVYCECFCIGKQTVLLHDMKVTISQELRKGHNKRGRKEEEKKNEAQ